MVTDIALFNTTGVSYATATARNARSLTVTSPFINGGVSSKYCTTVQWGIPAEVRKEKKKSSSTDNYTTVSGEQQQDNNGLFLSWYSLLFLALEIRGFRSKND